MLNFTTAQLDTWLALFMFPLTRTLALVATAPAFNNTAFSHRLRLTFGLVISLAIAPALPPMPNVTIGSWLGLMVLAEQVLIGVMMGFGLRLAFAAIEITGELLSMQMGLSFASFYDPTTGGSSPVVGQLLTWLALLIYLAMDGHLMTISMLSESFTLVPVSVQPVIARGFTTLVITAGSMFSAGLLLALPFIAALLITNIALGVLTRIAPTLNVFSIGFPITLSAGFATLMLAMPYLGAAFNHLFEQQFTALGNVLQAIAPH